MAGFSDRTKDGIERWVTTPSGPENKSWAERISDWFSGVIRWGIEIFMDAIGQAFAPKLKPLIENIESTGEVPEVLKPILEEMKDPDGVMKLLEAGYSQGAKGKCPCGVTLIFLTKPLPAEPTFTILFDVYAIEGRN